MKLNDYLDVIIPRGSAGLIAVVENATVPAIETGMEIVTYTLIKPLIWIYGENIVIKRKDTASVGL